MSTFSKDILITWNKKKTLKKNCILGLEIKETVKEKVDDAGNKISEEWNKRVVSFQPELWLNVNLFMLGLGKISKTRVFFDWITRRSMCNLYFCILLLKWTTSKLMCEKKTWLLKTSWLIQIILVSLLAPWGGKEIHCRW